MNKGNITKAKNELKTDGSKGNLRLRIFEVK
jgi:hypothetical protein